MKSKHIIMSIILLFLAIVTSSCSSSNALPEVMGLEDSIREIINSKDENYDFLNDELYMSKMQELGNLLIKNNMVNPEHITLGNLDDDNIPELVVFKERNPENKDDEGSLRVYRFSGEKYQLLDSVSMNYDNTNYQLVVGKISENQNGIYLNNQVGAHSGITYGFTLKEDKLISILNEKKVNLLSVYTNNEIKDIDNDGILEFSIYVLDPETEDSSVVDADKIRLWYKWNGNDGGTLVKVERFKGNSNSDENSSDKEILDEANRILDSGDFAFIDYLRENKDRLSSRDKTELLVKYISLLERQSQIKSTEINDLFSKYQLGFNHDQLFKKYGLSLERLNDMEYLSRQKILNNEDELKSKIISNLNLGYKLDYSEGVYHYVIDYQKILDSCEEDILKEYRDYLKILALNTNKPYLYDGELMISMEKLASRIILLENFKMTYPYSIYLDQMDKMYNEYIHAFLFGDKNNSNFDDKTWHIQEETLDIFKQVIDDYPHTNFSDITDSFVKELKNNQNKLNTEIKNKYNMNY